MLQITHTLREYHRAAVDPHHDVIATSVAADVAHHTRALRDDGLEGFFRSFTPLMTWRPPVLEIRYDVDQELHLDGRGLRFVPSFFCHGSPVSIANPELTPVVIYPLALEHRWTVPGADRSLSGLLGATRAAVLAAIEDGVNTTDLARILSISPASVSRHTAVLREAGLLVTSRHHNTVLHSPTTLGRQLVTRLPPSD